MKGLGLPKVCVLIGCLSMVVAVILRLTMIQIPVAGSAIIPRTLLLVANNFFLVAIALSLIKCPQSKQE